MQFNQNFVPGWNAIYANLITKVSKTIITANRFVSPWSAMLQTMEVGQYVEDIHIGLGHALLQDTIVNSDIFTDYVDDIAVSNYVVDVDLVFASTYREHVVSTSFTITQNVSELISALTANIRTTLEYWRSKLVKQMLYNGVHYGMIQCHKITDPTTSQQASGQFAVKLNTLIDDFRTELNTRNTIYNMRVGLSPDDHRHTICNQFPYVIIFNEYIRDMEFMNAVNLAWIEKFRSGNNNMDWQNRIINLNLADFPTSIPATNRSAVTGTNVPANDINFFEMPEDKDGDPEFSGVIQDGAKICAYIIDPEAFKLYTQLSIKTAWLNPATLNNTNREIYRGIMQLGAFNKICAITCD